MTFEALQKELDQKKYRPLYFLHGEEAYFIDKIVQRLEQEVLDESEKSFNQSVLYGKDVDVLTVVGEAKRYPMMAPYQVVIVKEAQHVKDWDPLLAYAKQPQMTTILVIAYKYKKLDGRKELAKFLSKEHVLFESKKLYDDKVQPWIENNVRTKGYKISAKAAALLAEFVGNDLGRLSSELDKLYSIISEGGEISATEIERNIGISKEYNNFELTKALGERDVLKANKIIVHFGKNPKDNPMTVTIGILFGYFTKLIQYHTLESKDSSLAAKALGINPFFLKDYVVGAKTYNMRKLVNIIGYLREYDLKSKGVGNSSASQEELLKEMIFKILH